MPLIPAGARPALCLSRHWRSVSTSSSSSPVSRSWGIFRLPLLGTSPPRLPSSSSSSSSQPCDVFRKSYFGGKHTRLDRFHWILQESRQSDVSRYMRDENRYAQQLVKKSLPASYRKQLARTLLAGEDQYVNPFLFSQRGPFVYFTRLPGHSLQYNLCGSETLPPPRPDSYPISCRETVCDGHGRARILQVIADLNDANGFWRRFPADAPRPTSVQSLALSPNQRFAGCILDTIPSRLHLLDLVYDADSVARDAAPASSSSGSDNVRLLGVVDNVFQAELSSSRSSTLVHCFYTQPDRLGRPNRVFLRTLKVGPPSSLLAEMLVYEERDPAFFVSLYASSDGRWLFIAANSKTSSEVRVVDIGSTGDIAESGGHAVTTHLLRPRQANVEYYAGHRRDHFFILTNADSAQNYKLMACPSTRATEPTSLESQAGLSTGGAPAQRLWHHQHWSEAIPERENVQVFEIELFENFVVLSENRLGRPAMTVWHDPSPPAATAATATATASIPAREHAPSAFLSLYKHLEPSPTSPAVRFTPHSPSPSSTSLLRHTASITFSDAVTSVEPVSSQWYSSPCVSFMIRSPLLHQQLVVCDATGSAPGHVALPYFLSEHAKALGQSQTREAFLARLPRASSPTKHTAGDQPSSGASPYACVREEALSLDGKTAVPVTLVLPAAAQRNGANPLLSVVYGAYGIRLEPDLALHHKTLLGQGWIIAFCHVRGGGERGTEWHKAGHGLGRPNAFLDFAGCLHHLQGRRISGTPFPRPPWLLETAYADALAAHQRPSLADIPAPFTTPGATAIEGTSAGGWIVGCTLNSFPGIAKCALLTVPFVDPLTSMLDSELFLTHHEWAAWGNPNECEQTYALLLHSSPYDGCDAGQVTRRFEEWAQYDGWRRHPTTVAGAVHARFPFADVALYVGRSDEKVQPWQSLKYAARLRKEMARASQSENERVPQPLVNLVSFDGQGHQFDLGAEMVAAEHRLAFLMQSLGQKLR